LRYLIISDIHANWEALYSVLQTAAGSYDRVLCCGDLIGYGADPNPVVDWARQNVEAVVRGNHDKACVGLEDLEWFNPVAKAAALWTRQELSPENVDYIRALPKGPVWMNNFQMVHGSPLDEDEYLVGASDASITFSYLERPVTFFGHTHVQGGFMWRKNRAEEIGKPVDGRDTMLLDIEPDYAYLINPGSVGQPRDGDARAAYILYDPDDGYLMYYRLPYDIEKAQAKIRRAGLPGLLADRLALGR
jgi:predicted phosphodiesterase